MPTKSLTLKGLESQTKITREQLLGVKEDWPFIGIVQPHQVKKYMIAIENIADVRKGTVPYWCGLYFRYQYGDDRFGEYCVIFEYSTEAEKFRIADELAT